MTKDGKPDMNFTSSIFEEPMRRRTHKQDNGLSEQEQTPVTTG